MQWGAVSSLSWHGVGTGHDDRMKYYIKSAWVEHVLGKRSVWVNKLELTCAARDRLVQVPWWHDAKEFWGDCSACHLEARIQCSQIHCAVAEHKSHPHAWWTCPKSCRDPPSSAKNSKIRTILMYSVGFKWNFAYLARVLLFHLRPWVSCHDADIIDGAISVL